MPESYRNVEQTRTVIGTPNAWTAVSVPIGARYPLLSMEDISSNFRVSTSNALNPLSQGIYIPAKGFYQSEGVNTDTLILYVSASVATTAIIIYTKD